MSIGPVDYQILMPKVNEVAKNQNADQQRLMGLMQQKVDNSSQKALNETKTVHSQKEAQQAKITEDQRRNQNKGNKENKKKDKAKTENKPELSEKKAGHGRTIDIRI